MRNEIGLAIGLARVAVGKAQWQVAAKIGMHASILNLIEAGKPAKNQGRRRERADTPND